MTIFKIPLGGACLTTPQALDVDLSDATAVAQAIEFCLNCRAYFACGQALQDLSGRADPGGIIAATIPAERGALGGDGEDEDSRRCGRCGRELRTDGKLCPACQTYFREYQRQRYEREPREDAATRTSKTCPDCRENKPIDEFHRNAAQADGRSTLCIDCQRERRRKRDGVTGDRHRL